MTIDPTDYYKYHLRQALSGAYEPHGDPATADCLIAAAFGYRQTKHGPEPGLSNQDLVTFSARFPRLPKIMQHEIAAAYTLSPLEPAVIRIDRALEPGRRLDTTELLEQAKIHMDTNYWKTALLVGHPNHLPWLDYLCRQLGITTVVPAGLAIRFDPESAQYWTRNLQAWQIEVKARQSGGNPRQISEG